MRVLLIGGTGNISAECARHLLGTGHEVFLVTRGKTAVLPEYQAICADRHNPEEMKAAARKAKAETVVNFIGYEVADVELDYAAFNGLVGQYVFISSATVHVKPCKTPVQETSPIGNDFWEYARKKADCEAHLMQHCRADGFPVTIVRPSHTYSKRWIPNAIASSNHSFAARLRSGKPVFVHDDGETPWTLTAASDFALGLAGLLGNPKAIGEAVQITCDEVLTWNQIYREICDALGVASPRIEEIPTDFICEAAPSLVGNLKGDKAHAGIFDTSKLKRLVPGFAARKPFRAGIRESVAWMDGSPDRFRFDPETDALIERVLSAWASRTKGA